MFDPASLEVVSESNRPESYFVGIKSKNQNRSKLCLPLGFDDFPTENRNEIRNTFFSLYKVLSNFQKDLANRVRNIDKYTKDTGYTSQRGASFTTKDGEDITLFAKIPMIERVLDNYDELKIFRIVEKPSKTKDIDYSKIYKYLENATYLNDNIPYVNEMVLPKKVLTYDESSIVRLFCFIYVEIKNALNEGGQTRNKVLSQASIFKYNHLNPDSSLFTESHDRTIRRLKDTLGKIDTEVGYKSRDYWHFHDAVEQFLYGTLSPNEDGISWGISTFSPVWEDMCLTYVFERQPKGLMYADASRSKYSNTSEGGHSLFISDDFQSPFYLERNGVKRYLRPDLVRSGPSPSQKFEDIFSVEWVNETTPKIKVDNTDYCKYLLDELADKLTVGGERFKPGDTSHKFSYVSKSHFYSVKEDFCKEYFSDKSSDILIYDIKYVNSPSYKSKSLSSKCKRDVSKQLVYEYAIQKNEERVTSSRLETPHYFSSHIDGIAKTVDEKELNDFLSDNDVGVALVSFKEVQKVYLESIN